MPVGCGGGARGVVAHCGEHNVRQSPFQAAQGLPFRLAGGPFAFVVGAAFGVAADLGERDRVKGLSSGSQTAELGVGAVDQGAAFTNQVFAVVEQGAQICRGTGGVPDRWQLLLAGSDPGDR
jgi:hypothetical protein